MNGHPRVVEGLSHVMVEFFVLVFADVLTGQRPEGGCSIKFFVLAFQLNGDGNVVGISLDDMPQA